MSSFTDLFFLGFQITLKTRGGHASVPPLHTGAGLLANLITQIEASLYTPQLLTNSPYLQQLHCYVENGGFENEVGEEGDNWWKWALDHLDESREELIERLVNLSPQSKYMLETSQAVDVIQSGVKVNALPELSYGK